MIGNYGVFGVFEFVETVTLTGQAEGFLTETSTQSAKELLHGCPLGLGAG